MSEHYYSRTQKVKSDPLFWDYQLRNFRIRFKTDNGVFSKKEVDFGSRLLIESFSNAGSITVIYLMLAVAMDQLGYQLRKMWPNRTVHMIDVN